MTTVTAVRRAWLAPLLLFALPAPAAAGEECIAGGDGGLQMPISGHFEAMLDWGNEGTSCAGGPRPDGDALRLMFNRSEESLLVVIGITGLERGATGAGLPANLTIVREGRAEFFGTLGADTCLVDVTANDLVTGSTDAYRVSGSGRCLAPIEAIARDGEIRVGPFEFTGIAAWPREPEDD